MNRTRRSTVQRLCRAALFAAVRGAAAAAGSSLIAVVVWVLQR
jgi:hypothetical protein